MVNASNAIFSRQLIQCFDKQRSIYIFTIQCHRDAVLKRNLQIGRLNVLVPIWIGRPGKDIFWWLCPGVFENAAFNASPPQVLIYRVGIGNAHIDRDSMLVRISDLAVPGHAPLANWRNDFQVRRQGID